MYYPRRALQIYKEDGLGYLVSQTKHFFRERAVPFRAEIWLRETLNRARYGHVPHPLTVLWVDSRDVESTVQNLELSRRFHIGSIKGGNWDQERRKPLSEWRVYRGLHQRFEKGMDWEETEYYRMGCEKIERNGRAWNCSSPEEFLEQRCRYVDELYENIEQNGYKRSTELIERNEDPGRDRDVTERHVKTHEISLAIGRRGTLMIAQGIHRFCLSRLLGLEEIPVQVLVRHREWQRLRNEIHDSGTVPSDIDPSHPDLQDLRS